MLYLGQVEFLPHPSPAYCSSLLLQRVAQTLESISQEALFAESCIDQRKYATLACFHKLKYFALIQAWTACDPQMHIDHNTFFCKKKKKKKKRKKESQPFLYLFIPSMLRIGKDLKIFSKGMMRKQKYYPVRKSGPMKSMNQ